MFKSTLYGGLVVFWVGVGSPAWAGYYSTFDNRAAEMRWTPDYRFAFTDMLDNLASIPARKQDKPDSPIRRRYILLEALGRDSQLHLETLEQKLNYATVLIRRGKSDEAVQFLRPIVNQEAYAKNFLVLTHYASALYLSNHREFKSDASSYMTDALANWPKKWSDLKKEDQAILTGYGWVDRDFELYRECEVCFKRLIDNRLKEDRRRLKKEDVPETLDPIFNEKGEQPIRFLNEQGTFAAGRIAKAEKDRLSPNALDVVEQLLIWMPNDPRLLWQLAEVLNASAMESPREEKKHLAIRNAHSVYVKLMDPLNRSKWAEKEVKERFDVINAYVETLPPEGVIPPPPEIEQENPYWRIGVGFLTGFFVGMIALWQFQEVRRRRQARASS